MRFAIITILAALLTTPAVAGELELPLGAKWCDSWENVEFSMEQPQEMAGEVLESTAALWGYEGFVTATFEERQLVNMRVRIFDEGDTLAKVRGKLEGMMGAGGESGTKVHWSPGPAQKVMLRLQSEQVYVTFEIDPDACGEGGVKETGLTDQEKADLEAIEKKQAIGFDPYADTNDEEQAVDKKKEEEKKEEKEEEKEEEEEDPDDLDIDW